MWPDCARNSIAMYELCKREGRGLNCRFLAQVLSEMYLAMGFPSRFVTCQSKAYDTDTDCHVINMVWSRQLGKWIWMDASFAAYVTDENGLLLHPGEVRERLIKGLPLVLNEDANWNHKTKQTKEGYLENYMAKNLYMLVYKRILSDVRKACERKYPQRPILVHAYATQRVYAEYAYKLASGKLAFPKLYKHVAPAGDYLRLRVLPHQLYRFINAACFIQRLYVIHALSLLIK